MNIIKIIKNLKKMLIDQLTVFSESFSVIQIRTKNENECNNCLIF